MKTNKNVPTVDLSQYRGVFKRVMCGNPENGDRGWLQMARLTQAELCRAAGIDKRMFSYYLSGERFPTPVTTAKIADALGLPYEDLRLELVMSEARGITKTLWVFGVESQTDKKRKFIEHKRKTVMERMSGVIGLECFNKRPEGIEGTTYSHIVSRSQTCTPTDLIDQDEWDTGGFRVVERVTTRPSSVLEKDWEYFQEIATRDWTALHRVGRPKSYRQPSKAANYVSMLVEKLREQVEEEQFRLEEERSQRGEPEKPKIVKHWYPPVWMSVLVIEALPMAA